MNRLSMYRLSWNVGESEFYFDPAFCPLSVAYLIRHRSRPALLARLSLLVKRAFDFSECRVDRGMSWIP